MALKRQQNVLAAFSMASMTDVVFLLLVFFMVTSTYVFPTGLDINLPQSNEQTAVKPGINVYLQADGSLAASYGETAEVQTFENTDQLVQYLRQIRQSDPEAGISLHGDRDVDYGRVVEILNIGAANNMRMVLATKQTDTKSATADGQ